MTRVRAGEDGLVPERTKGSNPDTPPFRNYVSGRRTRPALGLAGLAKATVATPPAPGQGLLAKRQPAPARERKQNACTRHRSLVKPTVALQLVNANSLLARD